MVDIAEFVPFLGPGVGARTKASDWRIVEDALGFEFPRDLKEFLSRYHGGEIDRELQLPDPVYGLVEMARDSSALALNMRDRGIVPNDVAVWPEERGIVGWASCGNGTRIYMRPEQQNSEAWTLCAILDDNSWYASGLEVLDFLFKLLTLELQNPLADYQWEPDEPPRFY